MKNALNLRYEPTKFLSLQNAESFASKCIKMHLIILGDDAKFWVVCFADAQKLVKIGYQIAL